MKLAMTKTSIITLTLVLFSQVAWGAVKGAPSSSTPGTGAAAKTTSSSKTASTGTPTHEIQQIEVKMDAYKTGSHLSAADIANNRKLKRDILTGTFDIRELCRLAMDKHWSEISAEEQSRFVELMTGLLEDRAIFAKEQSKTVGKKYVVKYLGDHYLDNKQRAKSKTKVIVAQKDVVLDIGYSLKASPQGWKIYDVIVDDASLVENYRYQFHSIIQKYGYPELVKRMENKRKEIRA